MQVQGWSREASEVKLQVVKKGAGTFSEAKETSTCNCTFSFTLPLPPIPISAGARMRRGGKVTWLDSGWHGKEKSGRASKGSLRF